MDVQTLEVSLGFPRLPKIATRPDVLRRSPAADPGGGRAGAIADHRVALLTLTGASIVAGLGALVWTTLTIPVMPAIDPGLDDTVLAGPNGGVLLWIAFGLVGSLRILPAPGGVTVWTFHFPFIAAAMVLGGPTAGAWVAFLSTLERRELETQPWYGALANHAVIAFAAVVGGLTVLVLEGALAQLLDDRSLARLFATAAGTLVLALVSNAIAAATVILRERLTVSDFVEIFVQAFGRMTIAEIGLAWVFTVAYLAVGWWAPLALAVIILAVWPGQTEGPDPLTGLPRLRAFEQALDGRLGRVRRGLMPGGLVCFIDLDGFGLVNKNPELGFAIGNEVLQEIGKRIRGQVRAADVAARLGGDEFAVFFTGAFGAEEAIQVARRLETAIRRPVLTTAGVVEVGASIGVVIVNGATAGAGAAAIMGEADSKSQAVKRTGGGVWIGGLGGSPAAR